MSDDLLAVLFSHSYRYDCMFWDRGLGDFTLDSIMASFAYCLTRRCDAVFEDLASIHDLLAGTITASIAAATLLGCLRVSTRRSCKAQGATPMRSSTAALLISTGAAVAGWLTAAAVRRLQMQRSSLRRESLFLESTDLHNCWDLERCDAHKFTVYMHRLGCNRKKSGIWTPPDASTMGSSPHNACVVLVPTDRSASCPADLFELARLPGWAGGRNHMVVDVSDRGWRRSERQAVLGCSALAQSHAVASNFIAGFDLSLPLEPPLYMDLEGVERALAHVPATARRFWLSFRGAHSHSLFTRFHLRSKLHALSNQSTAGRRILVRFTDCERWPERSWPECNEDEPRVAARTSESYLESYIDVLNTTFALLPSGRQPASMRLNDVLAAGAIPVFVTGDDATRDTSEASPYVLPLGGSVRWADISLHFSWTQIAHIPRVIGALSQRQVAAMQAGVREAWRDKLRPARVRHTVQQELRNRGLARGLSRI